MNLSYRLSMYTLDVIGSTHVYHAYLPMQEPFIVWDIYNNRSKPVSYSEVRKSPQSRTPLTLFPTPEELNLKWFTYSIQIAQIISSENCFTKNRCCSA